ncbi:disulfide isomerase/thiol-disulfide oxidase [Citrobacter koseri]|nr:disulfide isomerase/thiol-disulfide oxidase [Citrobacter koseri]
MIKRTLLLTLFPLIAFAEELPAPVKAVEKQGITILKSFDAPGGMKGYLGKYQDMGVTIYLTPDGKHAISGYMYDEKGANLSNALIEKEIYAPVGREMWQRMEKASWILDGKKEAPVILYVFADPFCPYCKQFLAAGAPLGRIRQSTIADATGGRDQTRKPGNGCRYLIHPRSGKNLA